MTPQPKDGHRLERPVITRTVPTPVVRSRCECGEIFEGHDRFELKREHALHRKAVLS